jgi:hypothetical protein
MRPSQVVEFRKCAIRVDQLRKFSPGVVGIAAKAVDEQNELFHDDIVLNCSRNLSCFTRATLTRISSARNLMPQHHEGYRGDEPERDVAPARAARFGLADFRDRSFG